MRIPQFCVMNAGKLLKVGNAATCKILVNPEASIFSHFLTPTAVSCTLPAGSCSGSCTGSCTGLLGRCNPVIPASKSLVNSVCDRDLRNVTVAWPLPLLYSAPEFFLELAGLEAPPLLLFSAGCFRTAVLGTDLGPSAGTAGPPSMNCYDRPRSFKALPYTRRTGVTTCSLALGRDLTAFQVRRRTPQLRCPRVRLQQCMTVQFVRFLAERTRVVAH